MKIIYCAGGQGRVVVDILRAGNTAEELRFVDDDTAQHGTTVGGTPVWGAFADVDHPSDHQWLIAFGQQDLRLDLAETVAATGATFFNAIHPSAAVSEATELGTGVTINAESYIGPGVEIGDHVLIDSCVNISHDVTLEDGATVTPSATLAGDVAVGQDAYIGPGATIVRGATVGAEAVVGAGAVVIDDVPADRTVVGVPASVQDD